MFSQVASAMADIAGHEDPGRWHNKNIYGEDMYLTPEFTHTMSDPEFVRPPEFRNLLDGGGPYPDLRNGRTGFADWMNKYTTQDELMAATDPYPTTQTDPYLRFGKNDPFMLS